MAVSFYLILATVLPLAGFLLLMFLGRRLGSGAGVVATVLVMGSLGLSIAALVTWVAKDAFNQAHYVEAYTYRWIPLPEDVRGAAVDLEHPVPVVGRISPGLSAGYFIDSLTPAMFVMVTFLASLVHLFSLAFMAGETALRRGRYFAYLGLFCFGMLGLILANSLVQVLACWEVAGVASYLLVGFWFERRGPATGALKGMVAGAIGDAAFVAGMGLLVLKVGAAGLTFYDAQGASPMIEALAHSRSLGVMPAEFLYLTGSGSGAFLGLHWLTWVGLLLFGGAAAKAAQFPLQVWLPEAMEAPLPAAALVHGTTYVGAGVYVVARIYPILTIDAHLGIAIVGCVTLLMGALMAVVETDLKRILAYSTMSQVGYMMLFLGAGVYTAGLVHLFTHAFFNGCLILAAGSVVRSLKGVSDVRQMGGLWRKLPLTALAFLLATLALAGAPFFSGAYSKGLGLAGVYEYAHALATPRGARAAMWLYYAAAGTTFVTAFYAGRCWWLVFAGRSRNEDLAEEAHEPFLMVLPIGILALLSFNFYEFFLLPSLIGKSLLPGVMQGGSPVIRTDHTLDRAREILTMRQGGYAYWGFLGVLPAILVYYGGLGWGERIRRLPVVNLVYFWLRERMFFDRLYNGVALRAVMVAAGLAGFVERYVVGGAASVVVLAVRGASGVSEGIDRHFVEGAAMGLGRVVGWSGEGVVAGRRGRVRVYLMIMVVGLGVLAGVVVLGGYGWWGGRGG